MNKYIDVEEIKNRLLQKGVEKSDIEFLLSVYKEHQEKNNILTADVRENVKSKWIENHFVDEKGNDYIGSVKCDNCGRILARKENYCPDCGADMRGEK